MTTVEIPTLQPSLHFLADRYEQAQRVRIETGERIRAIYQGRDQEGSEGVGDTEDPLEIDVDVILKEILAGEHDGPMPIPARTYRRHHEEEREMFGAMTGALEAHPTWSWLSQVKGCGPTLACKLLARLDITKADTPSAFWLYVGLATVPGAKYHCIICGLDRTWPIASNVKGGHKRLGTQANCKGSLEMTDEGDHSRAGMPRGANGQKQPYDG